MIEKIHNMLFEFIRDEGVCPKKIFMTQDDYIELKKEIGNGHLINIVMEDEDERICGLEINQTYPEVGMHLTT